MADGSLDNSVSGALSLESVMAGARDALTQHAGPQLDSTTVETWTREVDVCYRTPVGRLFARPKE